MPSHLAASAAGDEGWGFGGTVRPSQPGRGETLASGARALVDVAHVNALDHSEALLRGRSRTTGTVRVPTEGFEVASLSLCRSIFRAKTQILKHNCWTAG